MRSVFFQGKTQCFLSFGFGVQRNPKITTKILIYLDFKSPSNPCSSWWFPNQPMNEKYAHSSNWIISPKDRDDFFCNEVSLPILMGLQLPTLNEVAPDSYKSLITEIPCIGAILGYNFPKKKCALARIPVAFAAWLRSNNTPRWSSANGLFVWFVLVVWDSKGCPLRNNPFRKGIPGIQKIYH